ncbi:hypothetical protein PG999_003147 [Apiospora kogelbergensis]|uniref:Uncharacterized protein n=1 Tax=Apiospora kogelbergensis TaxID=1337665 RepID=A0AAW0RA63_9PEZI
MSLAPTDPNPVALSKQRMTPIGSRNALHLAPEWLMLKPGKESQRLHPAFRRASPQNSDREKAEDWVSDLLLTYVSVRKSETRKLDLSSLPSVWGRSTLGSPDVCGSGTS